MIALAIMGTIPNASTSTKKHTDIFRSDFEIPIGIDYSVYPWKNASTMQDLQEALVYERTLATPHGFSESTELQCFSVTSTGSRELIVPMSMLCPPS